MDEKDRVRFTALQRRKLQRFEDIVDDLEDLVTDGSPSSAELEARQGVIAEFREDGRRLNASFAGGTPSVVAEDPPETVLNELRCVSLNSVFYASVSRSSRHARDV